MNRSAKDDDYVDYSNITQLLEETILEPGKDYTDLYESQYYQSQIVSYVNLNKIGKATQCGLFILRKIISNINI